MKFPRADQINRLRPIPPSMRRRVGRLTGEFGHAKPIRKSGGAPEDLSAVRAAKLGCNKIADAQGHPRPGARNPGAAAGRHPDGFQSFY
jgi:hypothetical protein